MILVVGKIVHSIPFDSIKTWKATTQNTKEME